MSVGVMKDQISDRYVLTYPIGPTNCLRVAIKTHSFSLKSKGEESTCLVYTGFLGELEHLKIETRLIDEKFASVMK
jgi:hypothetical protein